MNTYYIYLQFTLVEREKMNSVQMALSSGRNGSGRNETRKHDVYTIEVTSLYILYVGMAHIFSGGERTFELFRTMPAKKIFTHFRDWPPSPGNKFYLPPCHFIQEMSSFLCPNHDKLGVGGVECDTKLWIFI